LVARTALVRRTGPPGGNAVMWQVVARALALPEKALRFPFGAATRTPRNAFDESAAQPGFDPLH